MHILNLFVPRIISSLFSTSHDSTRAWKRQKQNKGSSVHISDVCIVSTEYVFL